MQNQRWLSWLLLGVMGYLIYAGSQSRPPVVSVANPVVPAITAEKYPALAEATDIEHWKRTLNPDYAATTNCSPEAQDTEGLTLKVIEDAAGEGAGAVCGDVLLVHLTVWNSGGKPAFEGNLPLPLGARVLAQGLDVGLLGIKPGGVRTLLLPPSTLARAKADASFAAARKALPPGKLAVITVTRAK